MTYRRGSFEEWWQHTASWIRREAAAGDPQAQYILSNREQIREQGYWEWDGNRMGGWRGPDESMQEYVARLAREDELDQLEDEEEPTT